MEICISLDSNGIPGQIMLMAGEIPALVDICPENSRERIFRIEKLQKGNRNLVIHLPAIFRPVRLYRKKILHVFTVKRRAVASSVSESDIGGQPFGLKSRNSK